MQVKVIISYSGDQKHGKKNTIPFFSVAALSVSEDDYCISP